MRDARNAYVHARLRTDTLDRTTGHPSGVTCLVTAGGLAATSAAVDYNVIIWDTTVTPWRVVRKLRGEAVPLALALAPTGSGTASPSQLVTVSDDCGLRLWSLRTGQCKTTLYAHRGAATCCAWSAAGRWATGSVDGTVQVYDVDGAQVAGACTGHEAPVRCLATLGESFVVSGSDDATVRVWDVADARAPREVTVLRGHTDAVITVACCESGSGGTVVSGAHDRTIRVWSVRSSAASGVSTATCLHTVRAGSAPLCLHVTPYLLWAGLHSGTVAMYTRDTYECAHSIPMFAKRAVALGFVGADLVAATSVDKQHIRRTTFAANPRSAITGLGKALEAARRFAALAGAAGKRTGRMRKSTSTSSLADVAQRVRSGSGGDHGSAAAAERWVV
jgi:WD40 repeat protein